MKCKIIPKCGSLFATFSILLLFSLAHGEDKCRRVEDNTLISDKLPVIKVVVSKEFAYVGRFDFKIRDVAEGERFVFVDAADNKVKRLFIAQFEGFLSHVDDFYRYSFDNAIILGSHKFRHNNYAYSNKESRLQNPEGEGTLTEEFLKERGYEVEDELMMSRFITVPEENKKHELILFYLENVSTSKYKLSEFYKEDSATYVWKEIGLSLKARSLNAFEIK